MATPNTGVVSEIKGVVPVVHLKPGCRVQPGYIKVLKRRSEVPGGEPKRVDSSGMAVGGGEVGVSE